MRNSKVKIKGSIRKKLLKALPVGAGVTVISKNAWYKLDHFFAQKVADKNSKRMTIKFADNTTRDVCYFNLTCQPIYDIENLTKLLLDEDPLPF